MADTVTVGFVGLGDQGAPIARRIVDAGYPVVLWARKPEAVAPFADTSAQIASDLAELGARVDHLGICVVDDAGVKAVVEGALPTMRAGSRIVIHSTVSPATCVTLAEAAAARGVALIDAPVSGGGQGAAAGTLAVMVGGDEVAVKSAWPVFETFAGLILHLGGVGAGQRAKLVNNTLMAANMGLADAALAAAESLGIDRAAFVDLIKASSGRSYSFDVRARMPQASMFGHGAKLLSKDVGLLGAVLADNPAFATLDAAATPFLDAVMAAQSNDK